MLFLGATLELAAAVAPPLLELGHATRKLRLALSLVDGVVSIASPQHELLPAGKVRRRGGKMLLKVLATALTGVELAYTAEKGFGVILLVL